MVSQDCFLRGAPSWQVPIFGPTSHPPVPILFLIEKLGIMSLFRDLWHGVQSKHLTWAFYQGFETT